jgi:hypothetical protein
MIDLHFIREVNGKKKYGIRQVIIKDRVITFITPELNYQPLTLSIKQLKTALASGDARIEQAFKDTDTDLDTFIDDESIATSVIKDFQENGWRCIKR